MSKVETLVNEQLVEQACRDVATANGEWDYIAACERAARLLQSAHVRRLIALGLKAEAAQTVDFDRVNEDLAYVYGEFPYPEGAAESRFQRFRAKLVPLA